MPDLDKVVAELKNYKPTETDNNPQIIFRDKNGNPVSTPVGTQSKRPPTNYHPRSFICPNCGTIGFPKTLTKGSVLVEITLWLTFLIPGIIYSLWRLQTRTKVCGLCGAENMIPMSSPMGQKIYNTLTGT